MKNKIINFAKSNILKKKVLFFIIILALVINAFNSYVLAKYSTEFIINTSAKIAKPIVKVEGEETKEITVLAPHASYLFSVKNYNEKEEINEVKMKYYIEIISDKIELLEISLYKEEKEILLTDNKTEEMELKIGEKQEDEYCLDVKFLGNVEEDLLENVKANLQIKIHSIQIEE